MDQLKSASDVFAALASFGPAVDGTALTVASRPSAELSAVVCVLHTGVRAIMTGRVWFGLRVGGMADALAPSAPVPTDVVCLCVEGDGRWDRIPPAARLDHPGLFSATFDGPRR